jgi:mannitol-1-/sugar-/sorbitol-6-phosphatase
MILRCDAVLFDLDGVLVDSAACVEGTWRRWATRHHLDPATVIAEAHGRRTIDTIRQVAPELAANDEVAALAASESTTTEGVYDVPGARALLHRLPRTRWAIVTSGIRDVAILRITHTALPTPDILICAEDLQRGKPDPEGYLMAARRLGIPPTECIVVEDAPAGIEAATAAGMRSIAVAGSYDCTALSGATVCIASLDRLDVISASAADGVTLRVAPT